MSEYVRLCPRPDDGDTLRSMTVVPYLVNLHRVCPASSDEEFEEEEHVLAETSLEDHDTSDMRHVPVAIHSDHVSADASCSVQSQRRNSRVRRFQLNACKQS